MKSLALCLLVILCTPDLSEGYGIRNIINDGWRKFWSLSCKHSSIITRTKRSIEVPQLHTNNVDEIFVYLYPSAHLTTEDLKLKLKTLNSVGGGRSSSDSDSSTPEQNLHTPRTIFTWIDTTIDLWQTECRRQIKLGKDEQEQKRDMGQQGTHNSSNTTETPETSTTKLKQERDYKDIILPNVRNETYGNNTEIIQGKNGVTKQVIGGGLPGVPNLLLKQQDTFFAAFGGDIEYFIPLVSFGLPFDGEITLLGFHGFKGLFPYK